MTYQPKTHLGASRSACGQGKPDAPMTTVLEEVTCLLCVNTQRCERCRTPKPDSEYDVYRNRNGEMVRRRKCETCRSSGKWQTDGRYGDHSFPGYGKLCCTLCGEPLRDHRIGPCPRWGDAA